MNNSISNILEKIIKEYGSAVKSKFTAHSLAHFIRNESVHILNNLIDAEGICVDGSAGNGRWADVPWIAFLHEAITDTTQKGYYVVYLFSQDQQSVYLCLAFGTEKVKDKSGGIKSLQEKIPAILARIPYYENYGFVNDDITLRSDKKKSGRAKSYEEATIFQKKYSLLEMPSEDELREDLKNILVLYADSIYGEPLYNNERKNIIEHSSTLEEKKIIIKEFKKEVRHLTFEGRLSHKKIKDLKSSKGYQCDACDFNFETVYGEIGVEFIELHHLKPYSQLNIGDERDLTHEDFAVLCANCHRMIHKLNDWGDIEELQKRISSHGIKEN